MGERVVLPLREWRIRRGYGQRELARLAGVSHTTLTHLERGRYRGHPATWRKIAAVLEVDLLAIAEYRQATASENGKEGH